MSIDTEIPTHVWHGCYDAGWKGLIVPEAFAHPAKFSRGLITRIIHHGFNRGWWGKGDLIADPFGGVALGGIMCGYAGLNWIGVELEEKFWKLGGQNILMHVPKLLALRNPPCVKLVQGDSRNFAAIVGQAQAVVTSPPYADGGQGGGPDRENFKSKHGISEYGSLRGGYSETPGNIGDLPAGDVSAILTSPPYAETINSKSNGIDWEKAGRPDRTKPSPERISPGIDAGLHYGDTEGNIGSLKSGEVAAVVTSPPFQEKLSLDRPNPAERRRIARERGISNAEHISPIEMEKLGMRHEGNYGATPGQIGNDVGETYWAAMNAVYRQCFQAVKPGGVCIVVVKNYVQKKQIVNLCDDTLRLLEHIGFEPVERIHAMLTKTTRTPALFEKEHVTKTERKSFFRRLAEKKGSPPIDYEEVLVVRKPMEAVAQALPKEHLKNSGI